MKVLSRLGVKIEASDYAYVTNADEIAEILANCKKKNGYKINSDGSVDVAGSITLTKAALDNKGHLKIKFGKIGKDFTAVNIGLTSLEGSPVTVGADYLCARNPDLISLKGSPVTVRGYFACSFTGITSLMFGPQTAGGYNCIHCKLKDLVGAPKEVAYDFDCWDNQLTSLKGAPQKVGRDFTCTGNKLKDLTGGPKEVGNNLYCYNNPLQNLDGAPDKIGGRVVSNTKQLQD